MPFTYRPSGIYDIETGIEEPASSIAGKKALPVCGIANPSSFLETLSSLGAVFESRIVYPDQHAYDEKDIAAIEKAAASSMVITTEKDAFKLKGRIKGVKVCALRIEAEMDKAQFDTYLSPVLRGVW